MVGAWESMVRLKLRFVEDNLVGIWIRIHRIVRDDDVFVLPLKSAKGVAAIVSSLAK